jgi:hypothetical protein
MNTLIGLGAIFVLVALAVGAYLLPTVIAIVRHAPDLAAVVLINIMLGWCVFGWVVAMVLAVRRAVPGIQIIGQLNANLPSRQANAGRSERY